MGSVGSTLGCVAWPDISSPPDREAEDGASIVLHPLREFAAQGCVLQGFLGSGAIQGALWVLPAEGLEREIRDYLCLFLSSEVTGPLYKRPACSSIPVVAEATSGPACWRDCPSGISPHTASPPLPQGGDNHSISGQWSCEVCSFSLSGIRSPALSSGSWLWPSRGPPALIPQCPHPESSRPAWAAKLLQALPSDLCGVESGTPVYIVKLGRFLHLSEMFPYLQNGIMMLYMAFRQIKCI